MQNQKNVVRQKVSALVSTKVAELSSIEEQIVETASKNSDSKYLLQAFILTIIFLAILGFSSQLKAQQPAYVAEMVKVDGKDVEIYRRTTTDKIQPPTATLLTKIVGSGTDGNSNACKRQMVLYKNGESVMDEILVDLECDTYVYTHQQIEPSEYIYDQCPILKDEVATISIDLNGKNIHFEMFSFSTKNTLRKLKVPNGAIVTIVIRQQG